MSVQKELDVVAAVDDAAVVVAAFGALFADYQNQAEEENVDDPNVEMTYVLKYKKLTLKWLSSYLPRQNIIVRNKRIS